MFLIISISDPNASLDLKYDFKNSKNSGFSSRIKSGTNPETTSSINTLRSSRLIYILLYVLKNPDLLY